MAYTATATPYPRRCDFLYYHLHYRLRLFLPHPRAVLGRRKLTLGTQTIIRLSKPLPENLSKAQARFLDALESLLTRKGLCVLPHSPWTDAIATRVRMTAQSQGVIVFACGQWEAERLYRSQEKKVVMPSEDVHLQSVMAVACGRPLMVLRERIVTDRGVLRPGHLPHVVRLPSSPTPEWLESNEFQTELNKWLVQVQSFRNVFLGYSSKAEVVADLIHKFLTEKLGLTVFDWHEFRRGDTIWESIERAERSTACGLFLFMNDDKLASKKAAQFAPRDNVVYEAGYFAGAKGREQSLIIREDGAKVPSDLGGLLHFTLSDRTDISGIENQLRESLARRLDRTA